MDKSLSPIEIANRVVPSTKLGSINHLRLTVTDITRAEHFYNPLLLFLGYRLVEKRPKRLAWAGWAEHGNLHWFILSSVDSEDLKARHDRYAPGLHHLAFNADSREQIDRLHELLANRGVTILNPPAEYDYAPGYYAVFFVDPDNIKLELVHVPASSNEAYWKSYLVRGGPIEG